jgi:hypothetical protein
VPPLPVVPAVLPLVLLVPEPPALVVEPLPDPVGPLVDDPAEPDVVIVELPPPPLVVLLAPSSEHASAAPATHRKNAFEQRSIIDKLSLWKISVREWNSVFGGIPHV